MANWSGAASSIIVGIKVMQSRWFDEMPLLWKCSLRERGLIFSIRLMMKNNLFADADDLREAIGSDWRDLLDDLSRKGLLTVELAGRFYRLRVFSSKDQQREKNKILKQKRHNNKKGTKNEKKK